MGPKSKAKKVQTLTIEEQAAVERMNTARAAWIADLSITQDSITNALEEHLTSAMLDRVRFSQAEVWYARARTLASKIAHATGLSIESVAGVIAVMSPNVEWGLQEKYTLAFCQAILSGVPVVDAPGAGYGDNRIKAAAIVRGGDPHKIVKGPKVYPFFLCILGDESQVVVDVWMSRAAVDIDVDQDTAARIISPIQRRRMIMAAVRDLAIKYGLTPAIAQAAIWLDAKEEMEGSRVAKNRVTVLFAYGDYMVAAV